MNEFPQARNLEYSAYFVDRKRKNEKTNNKRNKNRKNMCFSLAASIL